MKCLHPDCWMSSVTRGLCRKHYMAMYNLVRIGELTWKQLEDDNKCLMPGTSNWFRKKSVWSYEI